MKNPLIIFAAFSLAAAVAVFTYYSQVANDEKAKIKNVEMISILVAKKPLKQGERLDLAAFEWTEWPKSASSKQYYTKSQQKNLGNLKGAIVRSPIQRGEPLKKEDLLLVGDKSILSAFVRPQMRAVTLPLTKIVNPSSLYAPGDVVDIVIPKRTQGEAEPEGETLIASVRIIAVDMEFQGMTHAPKKDDKEPARDPKTITIEVTAKQAEELAGAIPQGNIVVSQHSSFGPEQDTTPQSRIIESSSERKNIIVLRGGKKDSQP